MRWNGEPLHEATSAIVKETMNGDFTLTVKYPISDSGIYQLIQELAKKDKGIIMISSEMPELLGVTDRILVMSNGRVAGIVETAKTSQEEILQLAAKYL